ncbi:hypothetical protein BGW39_006492 [Mortierella sp. 14UC]|nr:hypothetical protein BGW39_006492 [Mortierella sp. 14UC]
MASNKRNNSLSIAGAIAGAIAAFLSISSLCTADRVFLTNNANSTDIYPGCPVDIGIRVQYSDLAQLKWVQLQVLGADSSFMIEGLDNSTRAQWDDTRTKSVTWTVPNDWPSGDYIVRAFGNASYPCQHGTRRGHCDFALEDRETFHLHSLAASQDCPAASSPMTSPIKPSSSDPFTNGAPITVHSSLKDASSGNSADSYSKSNLDLLSKNPSAVKLNPPSTAANGETSSNGDSNDSLIQKTINQSTTLRIQDQTILYVLDELRDYSLQKLTLTLLISGQVIPMSAEWTARRLRALHKDSSLIVVPPVNLASTTTTTTGTTMTGPSATTATPFNHTEVNPAGHGLVQQQDQNQFQDKSNDSSLTTGMTTTRGLFVGVLVAVIATMTI